MGKGRFAVSAAVALFAVLALAACGSSSDNGSSADQAQIKQALTAAATSGDPAACTKYQTLKFTEQTSGPAKGQAAIRACEKDAKSTAAKSLDITDVSVNGDSATAVAKATGSIFDGQTLKVALVKENGQWKLDEFQGFENFDKNAIINAVTALGNQQGESAQANNCVKQQFEQASEQTIQSAFVGNDQQAQQQLFGPCQKGSKGG
jgi:hypothetical protein